MSSQDFFDRRLLSTAGDPAPDASLERREANELRGVGPSATPPDDLTLDFLRDMADHEAERFLVSLPGVGPKSARCVLVYSLGRSVFR